MIGLRTIGRGVLAAVAVAGMAVICPSVAGAEQGSECPPGYASPGAVTLEEGLGLPRIVAGLEAGAYDVETLTAQFEGFDRNGDGILCMKAVSKLRASSTKNWSFFYLVLDNNHRG